MENIILNQMNALIMNINDKYWRKKYEQINREKNTIRSTDKRGN